VDECHTLPANTYFSTIQAFRVAKIRLGISATPLDRGDKKSIMAVASLGPVCWKISQRELVRRGVLSKAHIRMVTFEQESLQAQQERSGKEVNTTWKGEYGKNVLRSKPRNKKLIELIGRAAKPCLVFVVEKNHGKLLKTMSTMAGFNTEYVDGDKNSAQRRAAIERLEFGHNDVLVSTPIFKQGVDIPECRSVVIACARRSVIDTLQRLGRGSRRAHGKADYELWDIYDIDGTTLEKWSRERKRAYEQEGHDVELIAA